MKNKYWFLGLMWIAIGFSSCNDFLNCEPEDFADESAYFKTADDLKLSVNKFYDLLPKMRENNLGIHSEDNTSDNQIGTSPSNLFYMGDKRTVQQGSSAWYFTNLRGINFFINKTEQRLNNNEITGSESLINHYLGEGYFFRAYDHFRLLSNFGDCPIVTEMLPDDPATLAQATKRRPRNEVARFILSDLDKAIELLQQNAPQSGRITQDAAYLFKARVALYEATWEKYHASTCFVPGNNKWAGADYNSDFRFQSGNAQSEIQFFLDEAIAAADMVASTRQLNKDYISMFNNLGTFPDDSEVILARYYMSGIITHSCSNYLGRTGGGTGFSRSLVNSFLLTNGIPIYADSELYKGDRTLYDEMENRDLRLVNSVKGSVPTTSLDDDGNTIVNYFVPQITLTGAESATTGYQIRKWVSDEIGQDVYTQCTTSSPIFQIGRAHV